MKQLHGSNLPRAWIRAPIRCAALLLLLAFTVTAAPAQLPVEPDRPVLEVQAAASPTKLWVARIWPSATIVQYRSPDEDWNIAAPFKAAGELLEAIGDRLYMFDATGRFYVYEQEWSSALHLPGQAIPVALAGVDETPYALVAAEVAEELPVFTKDVGATTRPFEAGEAALGLVRYDRRGWRAVAACPAVVPGDAGDLLGPRLGYHAGRLLVAWVPEQGDQIITLWYALDEGRWETGSTISVPGLDAFWVPLVNRLPTIVARRETGAGVAGLRVFGFVPRDAREGERWKNVEAEFSPIALADPDGLAAEDPALSGLPVTRAFGFNQHLGVLQVEVLAAPEAVQGEPLPAPDAREPAALLRFARLGGEPAMKTVDVFADPPARPSPEPIQTLRLVVVLSILIMLFVFRRGALATPAPLPADYAPALFTQRLGALLVDLLPFALVATAFTPVRWDEVGGELFAWAFDAQLNETGLPRPELMYWWLITIGMYALYCLIMEAISARTVGKVLTRVRVVTTDGRRAVLWQVVGRNVFKVVELLPPFWIFAFVMVLSRNRQRIGDIFAYTLVVRQREATAERPPQDKPPPGPPES